MKDKGVESVFPERVHLGREASASDQMKRFLNRVRYNYFISLAAQYILWPIQKLCETIARQIKLKVWINGGTVDYDGIAIAFPRNVGVPYCSGVFWNGAQGFEPDTWRVIKHFIADATVFVDVGSNIGFYSVLTRKANPKLQIFSYEPVPNLFRKNIAFHIHNGCEYENVSNIAIGDQNGTQELFLPIVRSSIEEESTATLRSDSWQRENECETFAVTVMKLDTLLSQIACGDKVLIKIDVEDFESSVFKGAGELMQSVKPVFVCEILPREHGNQETYSCIDANGYVPFAITSVGLVRFDRADFFGKRSFTDFLVLPEVMAPQLSYLHHSSLSTLKW